MKLEKSLIKTLSKKEVRMPRYDAQRIEPKWQKYWEDQQTFRTGPFDPSKPKLYVLDMFPYPSGSGLHVGHPEGYTATDIVCRFRRMQGQQVLHPMGWDAFGLPAEEHAIKTGEHPSLQTLRNIDTFRRQLKMLGFSYDWSRELSTTDENYYRWTQWIFLKIFDTWYDPHCQWTGPDGQQRQGRGRPISELPIPAEVQAAGLDAVRRYQDQQRLAYQDSAPVNWCAGLGTALSNEEIIDGKSERGGHPVVRLPLRQWMLGITHYADRLLEELEELSWPESIKEMQRNWIGRSVGAEVDFSLRTSAAYSAWQREREQAGFPKTPGDDVLRVYTTRPDTLFGATYMVIAPEHPFVERLTTPEQRDAVRAYCQQATLKSDLDRTELAKSKTGVFTGSHAINPVNGQAIPVWIADYVLISYGTGAIMAVPAHDLRDWEFAVKFNIPIIRVVEPPAQYAHSKDELALGRDVAGTRESPFVGLGTAINSERFNGLPTDDFKRQIITELTASGLGREAVNYRLRDWLFSRQRYWGEPFPIWHELGADGQPTGLLRTDAESDLPVVLPMMAEFKPTGTPEPMLSKAPAEWLYKTASDGTRLMRETNTMPQWAGSCWYYLRFVDPQNTDAFIDPLLEKQWLPIDLYVGGAEHAVLHLLYSRFWHKVLFDLGYVSSPEPFQRLVNQGLILGEVEFTGYRLEGGAESDWVSSSLVSEAEVGGQTLMIDTQTKQPVKAVKLDASQVEKRGDRFVLLSHPEVMIDARAFKMSKSRGNVVNPDSIVRSHGADALRLFEMFMGPLEQVKPWSMSGVEGVFRFLCRVWRMVTDDNAADVRMNPAIQEVAPSELQERLLHKTIKAVTRDIDTLGFNTAISRMMEFTNVMGGQAVRPRSMIEPFVLLLSPFAPHIAEELWEVLGHSQSLAHESWPTYDEAKIVEAEIEIPVQTNGKLRTTIKVPTGSDPAAIEAAARANSRVQELMADKTVVKVICVPGRMINFILK